MGQLDLTGQRFGKLTVIERTDDYVSPSGIHAIMWKCICDCGNTCNVTSNNLRRGNTKSCGCLKHSFFKELYKDKNKYDLTGEYGIGYTSKGEEFYFDLEDFEKIKDYKWYKSTSGYIMCKLDRNYCFHKIVMGVDGNPNIYVDHIHGYKTRNDNRKYNLRIVTKSQNNMNKRMQINNTSGITGVYWDKNREKWLAAIQKEGKQINLGRYDTKEEAAKARKEAEEKYFGEYSYGNSQKMTKE